MTRALVRAVFDTVVAALLLYGGLVVGNWIGGAS